MKFEIFCKVNARPNITVLVDSTKVDSTVDWTVDQYGNICVSFFADITAKSKVSICVDNLPTGVTFNIIEIIVDDIRFGLVTFLCSTVSGVLSTQLNADGAIDIEIQSPIWKYWCEKMNSFNYKDYPLGSTN